VTGGAHRPEGPVVGIDLGGTKVQAVVLDPDGGHDPVVEVRVDTPGDAGGLVSTLAGVVAEVDGRLGGGRSAGGPVVGVGVGAAGLVDAAGVLHDAPNLPGVVRLDLAGDLAQATGRPVAVDNDATAAMLAEWRLGAARGARDAVLVTLGTGIGAGVVMGGALQRGAMGFAGEPGHMMVDPTGPPCPCGRSGCWERFASGSGLGRLARDAAGAGRAPRLVALAGGDAEQVRGEHVAAAAAAGDADALGILDGFAWWVAVGLANLVNILDSELVVVGGGLSEMGELLMAPVRQHFGELVLAAHSRPAVELRTAALGARAGASGAWLLADARRVG